MRILAAGGGSGGHVTPVVAVLHELRRRYPDAEVRFWCDAGFEAPARSLIASFDSNIRVDTVVSGKLRRYHALPWWQQAIRWQTIVWPNIRDSLKVAAGVVQSVAKLLIWRPDIVFTKGGFVCLPIGVAARLLRIPLVIHDSDAHPGLTNRILARWADRILTGAPLEYYPYPAAKSRYVGIPIQVTLDNAQLEPGERKQRLGLETDHHLIVCTGGGLGATRINQTIVSILPQLITNGCSVVLVTGEKNYDETIELAGASSLPHVTILPFISGNMHEYFAAADVVVTRAGATTLLELAALARPTVIIPNIHLTGGHQTKNAAVYAEHNAAVIVDEAPLADHPELLAHAIIDLIDRPERRRAMAQAMHKLARPNASRETVDVLIEVLRSRGVAG